MLQVVILTLIGLLSSVATLDEQQNQISIRMPDIRPDHGEQYLCIAHRIPVNNKGLYITGFNPQADAGRVHHMLMYGCEKPGIFQRDSPSFVWNCGEMHTEGDNDLNESFEKGPFCGTGKQDILYGWALDAPALKLDKDLGFKIGGIDGKIRFLVLQVHYGHYEAFEKLPDLTDNSGLILDVKQNTPESGITRQAGVLLLISLGKVLRGKSKHEIWCDIKDDIEIHPFRYRVHTHKLGTKVLGAKLGGNQSNNDGRKYGSGQEDRMIGVGDPQKPQMFYPVKEKDLTLKKGDSVYARCEFNNNKTHNVEIGNTGDDEMCNFYLMYWTKSPKLLSSSNCFSVNPSRFSFFW